MRFQDFINRDMVLLNLGDTLEKAIKSLKQTKLNMLPVVNDQWKLIGVFTRINLYNALLNKASLDNVIDPWIVKDVLSKLQEDMSLETVEEITKKSTVGSAPVMDKEGNVVGVLTKTNMILSLFKKSSLINAQLTAGLDAMSNGVVAFDDKGCISLTNKSAEKMLGLGNSKSLGLPWDKVIGGLDLQPVLKQGKVKTGLKYVRGNMVTIVNIMPIIDDVTVKGAVAVFHDLSELKQMTQELEVTRSLNRTLDTVINSIFDGIVVVDERGYVTLINQVLADFLRINPTEVLGKHITKVLENSRLHIVARTGVPELNEVQNIGDKQYLVSRLPIIKNEVPSGSVGKVVFPQLPEIQELVRKLNTLQGKVAYYEEELQNSKIKQLEVMKIIGTSPIMLELKGEIGKVSRTNSTVLITGESGTGKELVAHAVHYESKRKNRPFIKMNCAAIPENLLESEIFGYVPGAFSGANRNGKPGRFELADKGTLFLDEIGDMSGRLQAKLLRVLQEREFERVGGTKTISVDVRIVTATNMDLEKAVANGTFREDLYYRLNVINLHMPPLRDRKNDIELLSVSFINKLNRILKTEITQLSPEVLDIFMNYSWPGNIRELQNIIERAANYATKGEILPVHLPLNMLKPKENMQLTPDGTENSYRDTLKKTQKEMIIKALEKSGGNKTKAAKLLNMSRNNLYSTLQRLGIK
ncbi:MAG: sigma 54-interacting transcriptional regulator [Desulfitobacteriaceae bacterium]|nr:sigma 54-interacting transcriptional regulator [Desulfitobacteriaceae bacterium]MDD4346368.1 sigma 54-interacting transcriptional regulator [Desulfitobacteriaceae bacterium]